MIVNPPKWIDVGVKCWKHAPRNPPRVAGSNDVELHAYDDGIIVVRDVDKNETRRWLKTTTPVPIER